MKMGTLSEMAGKWKCSKLVRNLDSKFITTIDPPIFYIVSYNRGKMNNFAALEVALVYILYRYECGKTRSKIRNKTAINILKRSPLL